jgi:GT2 family glycosyltransferase
MVLGVINAANHVTVVSVTYGDRRQFVEPMLRAALDQGVGKVILVSNGSPWDVEALAASLDSARIEVFRLEHNLGSAGGYAMGIAHAQARGAKLVWLLDDDNIPQKNCLAVLLGAYERALAKTRPEMLAVLAFRADHHTDVVYGIYPTKRGSRPDSFLGFHILDIPQKLWRRTPWGKPRMLKDIPAAIQRETAPYSGLLFDITLIQNIGLPKTDLVLYADDIEFTRRLTHTGGEILLVPPARLMDMECTWNTKRASTSSSFMMWLQDGGDFRAYYSARNLSWVETHTKQPSSSVYLLNKLVYLTLLYSIALINGRLSRFRLLYDAIADGEKGHLGINLKFPLP